MKRIFSLVLVAILPFGSALAGAPKSKNAKVTIVYQHELPNVPGNRACTETQVVRLALIYALRTANRKLTSCT
jgi:hypothetical protein